MHLLTTEQAETFLREHLGDDVQQVSPVGQGDWTQAFFLKHGRTNLVVRFGAHIEDFTKDKIASRFSVPRLPVPRVIEIGQALDRYFCLSERAYGAMLESLLEDRMVAIVPAVFGMLDALRETDVTSTTGFGGWHADGNASQQSWREYLLDVDQETERVCDWHARLDESPTGATPFNEALAYLKSHVDACPETRSLLHTDLLHFNVLVGEEKINAVVDWGNAMYGDFLYELAAFSFYAPWYPAMARIDWANAARKHYEEIGLDVPQFSERLRCYEAHIGLGGMAYSAFTRRWDDLEGNARRTLRLIRGEELDMVD